MRGTNNGGVDARYDGTEGCTEQQLQRLWNHDPVDHAGPRCGFRRLHMDRKSVSRETRPGKARERAICVKNSGRAYGTVSIYRNKQSFSRPPLPTS